MPLPLPTLYQIISTDYLAQNLFIMIFGPWVIYAINTVIEKESFLFMIILAAICTPVGLAAFYWRYRTIVSTFEQGVEIQGNVLEVHALSTGKRRRDYIIDYEYVFQDQIYQYRNRVKNNDVARSLQKGQQLTLIVNSKSPKTAFIKDMYLVYP